MRRYLAGLALVPMLLAPVFAQEQGGAKDEIKEAAEAARANPDSIEAINSYMTKAIGALLTALENDPDAAEAQLKEIKAVVDSLEPQTEEGKQLLVQAKNVEPILAKRILLARSSLDDLKGTLRTDPNDAQALTDFREKLIMELGTKAYSAPAEADETLTDARTFLAEVKVHANEEAQQAIAQTEQVLEQISGQIEANLGRERLVGKDAAPLSVEAWVNGEPLTDSDLEGKVVLLDFWAVWCGPCVATFPHLIEWNEQYADRGLVIIGLTSYYEFGWDEQAERAVPKPGTSPEEERAMLEKFAEHHGLTHRFAIQDGDAMSEYYQVTGIPQAVVIDQQGKIRMVRVGSGEQNAQDISGMLRELLGAPANAGE